MWAETANMCLTKQGIIRARLQKKLPWGLGVCFSSTDCLSSTEDLGLVVA